MKRFLPILWFAGGIIVGVCLPSACERMAPHPAESPEEILESLSRQGLRYEGKWLTVANHGGFHVKPEGDKRTWEELAGVSVPAKSPRHVIFIRSIRHEDFVSGRMPVTGDFDLIGDPEEINRILEALR